MEKPDNQSNLPKVEQDDILSLVLEEIHDSNHMERWERFSEANPVLAREVLQRAYIESVQSISFDTNRSQFEKRVIDTVSFVISALDKANQRQRNTFRSGGVFTNDDAGDEDQPLSA